MLIPSAIFSPFNKINSFKNKQHQKYTKTFNHIPESGGSKNTPKLRKDKTEQGTKSVYVWYTDIRWMRTV